MSRNFPFTSSNRRNRQSLDAHHKRTPVERHAVPTTTAHESHSCWESQVFQRQLKALFSFFAQPNSFRVDPGIHTSLSRRLSHHNCLDVIVMESADIPLLVWVDRRRFSSYSPDIVMSDYHRYRHSESAFIDPMIDSPLNTEEQLSSHYNDRAPTHPHSSPPSIAYNSLPHANIESETETAGSEIFLLDNQMAVLILDNVDTDEISKQYWIPVLSLYDRSLGWIETLCLSNLPGPSPFNGTQCYGDHILIQTYGRNRDADA
eukprot:GHVO01036756.1.p1 GENE.GHVO01036756.1~~GHVO01036756.1.p1  ORF type:complete len:261 (-),score=16.37 GHVO01036756.1:28-810(-)